MSIAAGCYPMDVMNPFPSHLGQPGPSGINAGNGSAAAVKGGNSTGAPPTTPTGPMSNAAAAAAAAAAATVLPPPRSYYVVSWVPRALPEVVQLVKEIPSEAERFLINRHFELGMLVMRRCGVQNPEEIKCLLDGFREGTTRLSASKQDQNNSDCCNRKNGHGDEFKGTNGSNAAPNGGRTYTQYYSSPAIERRKLLIFFNDHRASRPWVLCPAKHCIRSARTTGKVKGRVKIFQFDPRSATVKVPKLFLSCLSEFLTRDQYVFATFCPQQKYTDHELEWFDLPNGNSNGTGGEGDAYEGGESNGGGGANGRSDGLPGGDIIFRELIEDHDTKGMRLWPFEDYIIFSNSQAKIVAVFKKKQPLLTLYRHAWSTAAMVQQNDVEMATAAANAAALAAAAASGGLPPPDLTQKNGAMMYSPYNQNGVLPDSGDDRGKQFAFLTSKPGATTTTSSTATTTTAATATATTDFGSKQVEGLDDMRQSLDTETEESAEGADTESHYRKRRSDVQQSMTDLSSDLPPLMHQPGYAPTQEAPPMMGPSMEEQIMMQQQQQMQAAVDSYGAPSLDLMRQAEEAELLLVRVMARVLAQLEPVDGPPMMDAMSFAFDAATRTARHHHPGIAASMAAAAAVAAAAAARGGNGGGGPPKGGISNGGGGTVPGNAPNGVYGGGSQDRYGCNEYMGNGGPDAYGCCYDQSGIPMDEGSANRCCQEGSQQPQGSMCSDEQDESNERTTSGGSAEQGVAAESFVAAKIEKGDQEAETDNQDTIQKKVEFDLENKRRKLLHYQPSPPSPNTVLYHELVRQFFSRLAYGLDHPPVPQKRIPDTVKRVVTKIAADSIKDINLALLTHSVRSGDGSGAPMPLMSGDGMGGPMDFYGNPMYVMQDHCAVDINDNASSSADNDDTTSNNTRFPTYEYPDPNAPPGAPPPPASILGTPSPPAAFIGPYGMLDVGFAPPMCGPLLGHLFQLPPGASPDSATGGPLHMQQGPGMACDLMGPAGGHAFLPPMPIEGDEGVASSHPPLGEPSATYSEMTAYATPGPPLQDSHARQELRLHQHEVSTCSGSEESLEASGVILPQRNGLNPMKGDPAGDCNAAKSSPGATLNNGGKGKDKEGEGRRLTRKARGNSGSDKLSVISDVSDEARNEEVGSGDSSRTTTSAAGGDDEVTEDLFPLRSSTNVRKRRGTAGVISHDSKQKVSRRTKR